VAAAKTAESSAQAIQLMGFMLRCCAQGGRTAVGTRAFPLLRAGRMKGSLGFVLSPVPKSEGLII